MCQSTKYPGGPNHTGHSNRPTAPLTTVRKVSPAALSSLGDAQGSSSYSPHLSHLCSVQSAPVNPAAKVPEPMQIGLIRPSSPEVCLHRRQNNLCLISREAGHYLRTCPAKTRKCSSIACNNLSSPSVSVTHFPNFSYQKREVPVTEIIDSGACSCFIDLNFAMQQRIPLQPKTQSLADGSCIKFEIVTQETSSACYPYPAQGDREP